MRIERVQIDGFGHFQGLGLELKPGLNLICGPNEAGKSTLLAFVRSVLFGFERRGDPSRYEPAGGPYGGELHLWADFGRLRVRRAGGKRVQGELTVRNSTGEVLPPSRLDDALCHVEQELFYEVFAFNLDALASFDRLAKNTSIGEALFAAGMRGARRLPEAAAELRKSSEELFSARASQKRLNAAFRALEQVQEELAALGDRPAEYFASDAERARVSAQLGALQGRAEALSRQVDGLERLERCAKAVVERRLLAPRLPGDEALLSFPDDAVARLEAVLDSLARVRSAQRLAEEERNAARTLLASVPAGDPAQVAAVEAALAVVEGRSALDRALPSRRATYARREEELRLAHARLGLPVGLTELPALDLGGAAKASLVDARDALNAARQRLRERETQRELARTNRSRASAEAERLEGELRTMPAEQAAEVRRRQWALSRVLPLRDEASQVQLRAIELEGRLQQVQGEAEAPPVHPFPGWAAASAVALFAAAIAAVAALLPENLRVAGIGGVLAAIVVGLAWWRGRKAFAVQLAAATARAELRSREQTRLAAALAEVRRDVDRARTEAEQRAAEAGVDVDAEEQVLQERDAALTSLALAIEQRTRLEELLRVARTALAAADAECERAEEQLGEAAKAVAGLEQTVAGVLGARGLPAVSADHALELWNEAAGVQRQLAELEAERASLEAGERERVRALTTLRAALESAGVPPGAAEDSARIAREACARWSEERDERRRLEARLSTADSALKARGAERTELEQRLGALFERTGCASEEALRSRAQLAAEARAARARANTLEIEVRAATALSLEEAERQLDETGGADAVAAKRTALAEELGRVRAEIAGLQDRRGQLTAQLQAWEHDAKLAELREREERLGAEIRRLAERYVVDRLALGMLERARARHEREHQPRLLAEASIAFSTLTGGRYLRVLAPLEGRLEVEARDGQIWSAEKLSRGTQNQLYLAFRIALVREFHDTRGPLPVILDDILVNFDPQRAEAAVKTFGELASTHQVIAFSCQPHLRESFEANGAHVLDLPALQPSLLQARIA